MKRVAVLILALSCCLCETLTDENRNRVRRCHGSNCCHDTCSLTPMSQTIGAMEQKVAYMAEKITCLEERLQNTEREVQELRCQAGGKPQVAFSAALFECNAGETGPFSSSTPLKYEKVFSNYGNSYNPATGIFTAHVRGMYFFRFSMFNNRNSVSNSVVSLMKNSERLISVWDTSEYDNNDMGSNGVVISLEVGDCVYVELQANRVVFDDCMNYNTFSGFLLFTM